MNEIAKYTNDFIKKDPQITIIMIVSATIIILKAMDKYDNLDVTHKDTHIVLKKNV